MADPARTGTVNLCSERALKTCLGCKETKPLEAFHKCKTVKDGRKGRCAACCRADSREWRASNPDKQKAAVDSWRERNAEKYAELKRESDRQYRLGNIEKIKSQRHARRDEINANLAEWKRNNREKVRDYERRRRALMRGSQVGEIDFAAVWEKCDAECILCGETMDQSLGWPDPLSVSLDHIIPLAKQGPHVTENVQYVHLVCNMRKNDSVPA